jgi:TetR/AcrR family transcriptional regulator, transcriptional repressor for nem operon
MPDFLSGIGRGKAKVQRRTRAIVALASMIGAMILARGSGDSTFSNGVFDIIATAIPATTEAAKKKPRR